MGHICVVAYGGDDVEFEPHRQCRSCGHRLSRYNGQPLCGACARARVRYSPVPPQVWAGESMRTALGLWDWAAVLTLVTEECGLSQLQLAALTGFSQPHISRLMKGQ